VTKGQAIERARLYGPHSCSVWPHESVGMSAQLVTVARCDCGWRSPAFAKSPMQMTLEARAIERHLDEVERILAN
jgi:hypothetical protein